MSIARDICAELIAKGRIESDDVLRIRRAVFQDGTIARDEVDAIFRLDRECPEKDESWHEFFIEELTYHFVSRIEPRGYIDDANARFLMDEIARDGRLSRESELELLVNIMEDAVWTPEALDLFTLAAVKESVLSPDGAAYGRSRRPGVITQVDVEIIRTVIYGSGGPGTYTVTKREAEFLFELSSATAGQENAHGWTDLFARGVGCYLMFPSPAPILPTPDEIKEHDAWIDERKRNGSFLKSLGMALFRMDRSFGELDLFGRRAARERAEREEREARESQARARVDEAEARWLAEQIGNDGKLSEDEQALLSFIAATAAEVHQSLEGLFARAGIECGPGSMEARRSA